jgi:hypothetical protein
MTTRMSALFLAVILGSMPNAANSTGATSPQSRGRVLGIGGVYSSHRGRLTFFGVLLSGLDGRKKRPHVGVKSRAALAEEETKLVRSSAFRAVSPFHGRLLADHFAFYCWVLTFRFSRGPGQ